MNTSITPDLINLLGSACADPNKTKVGNDTIVVRHTIDSIIDAYYVYDDSSIFSISLS